MFSSFQPCAVVFAVLTAICFGAWLLLATIVPRLRKVFDHLGALGDREIARTPRGFWKAMGAGAGAGGITAGTVALKVMINAEGMSPMLSGALSSLNYAVSFLLIQFTGFRLATKPPALMGSAFASRAGGMLQLSGRRSLGRELASILKTQYATAVGNMIVVIPAAAALLIAVRFGLNRDLLAPESARVLLESLNPWKSAALVYAFLTGGVLWMSATAGGLVAGLLPRFSKNAASAVFNIALGVMLGMLPAIGNGLGVAIDIRHFTLSFGNIALAAAALGPASAVSAGLLASCVGVLGIGALNCAVSFSLAAGTTTLARWWNTENRSASWAALAAGYASPGTDHNLEGGRSVS